MALVYRYYFDVNDGSRSREQYEYEVSYSEASDYIRRTHSDSDILEDYIDSGLYSKETEGDKETLRTYGDFDGTVDSIEKMSIKDKANLVDELLFDILEYTDIYDDELQDYFEYDAYDSWLDQQ